MTDLQKQVLKLNEMGLSVSEISKVLNRRMSSVSSVLKKFNLVPHKKFVNTINEHFFDIIDSETKAYILGFTIADGSISKNENRISFNLQEEDGYILEKFAIALNSPNSVQKKFYKHNNVNRKPQCVFRFSSKNIKQTLCEKYNITPNKTYNFNFEFNFNLIPQSLHGAFIRGFLDGDGSFESKNGVFTPSFIGTSLKWLTQIAELLKVKTGLNYKIYKKQGKTCVYYTVRLMANNLNKTEKIKKLYEFLYNNETICLKRKKDKIEKYLEYRANQIRVKGIWRCNA